MAFCTFRNVRMSGVAAGVPKIVSRNLDFHCGDYDATAAYSPEKFVKLTGVEERRTSPTLTASDLSLAAAERLLSDLGWDKGEIDALIFVSQTPDYTQPATACILQDRLGLSEECYATDIPLGCSGWVYGLSVAAALMSGGSFRKALLMAGDAKGRVVIPGRKFEDPLLGHAATVTALEYLEGSEGFKFHLGTDGSGYDAIITPDGGSRNPVNPETSFALEEIDGAKYCRLDARMKGMDVFAFGITTAPKSVRKLAEHFGFDYRRCDYYLFHQANKLMNDMIAKKLKLDPAKVPCSMRRFGNTSSASIPLTLVTELKGKAEDRAVKFLCCGFGVGLSWGTVAFETDRLVVSDLVEVEEERVKSVKAP